MTFHMTSLSSTNHTGPGQLLNTCWKFLKDMGVDKMASKLGAQLKQGVSTGQHYSQEHFNKEWDDAKKEGNPVKSFTAIMKG